MSFRPYVLRETPWSAVRPMKYSVAVLPWGATEAHNFHLPYGTDIYEAESVAIAAAALAWENGARAVVLPAVPFGVNTGQLDIPLTLNLNPSTQLGILRDIVLSLEPHGLRRLVIVNGHGGNDFKPLIRELQPGNDLTIVTVNWWQIEPADQYFDQPGDHAGEAETSVMLHIAPGLVQPLDQAGDGRARTFRVRGLREGWAWTPRRWTAVTDDTGVGNPAAATAAKGERFFTAITRKLADLLIELANVPDDQLYMEMESQ
jgi:creatinine amidohydrolase